MVEILGRSYVIGQLDYTVIRKLARKWQLETVADVEQKITATLMNMGNAANDDGSSLRFDAIDTMGEIIITVLEVYNDNVDITDIDKLMSFFMNENIEAFSTIIETFTANMQPPETPKQLQVVAKKKPKKPVPPKNRIE